MGRFPFTQKQLRKILYTCYHPESNVCRYEGGRESGLVSGSGLAVLTAGYEAHRMELSRASMEKLVIDRGIPK